MKRIGKLFIIALLIFHPYYAKSQNWMMAQHYADAALDSIMDSPDVDPLDYVLLDYSHFTYDPANQEYRLFLNNDNSASTSVSLIRVNLHGGTAKFSDLLLDPVEFELPDWSDCVFIWNATGKSMSFSLSCNDSEFSTYTLDINKFNRYHCGINDNMYIKIRTLVDGAEAARVHYKLLKGKGYKGQWDSAGAKFEVYADDRLN